MNLPMSWDEWADHDGVALAARVAKGELTAAELAAQAAAGIAKVDPALSGVVEIFEDAVADPATDGTNLDGPFAGLPFLMKDLGPTMQGRLQEMGSLMMRGNRATADTFLTKKLRAAGLNLVGRQRRDGRRRRGADRACHRRRRLDPDSRRGQRQYRAKSLARRVLAVAAAVRPQRTGLHPGLPVAHGARHRGFRRRLPRSGAGRIHAVLEFAGALYADDHARSGPAENRAVVQVGRLPGDAADRGRTAKGRALPRRPRPSRRLRLAGPGLSRSLRG